MYVCMYVCIKFDMCKNIYVGSVHIYIYLYVCMYVCMWECIHGCSLPLRMDEVSGWHSAKKLECG